MITSVWRALRHSGLWKAGTPLEMASTPVTAEPPEANALASTKADAPISRPVPSSPNSTMPSSWTPSSGRSPVR